MIAHIFKKLRNTKTNFIKHIRVICNFKHIAKYKTLLEPGTYKIHWFNKPILFNINTGTEIQKAFQTNVGFCDKLFRSVKIKILCNEENKDKKCQAVMLIYKKERYKLFNLREGLILTFFPNGELEKYIKKVNMLKRFYNTVIVDCMENFVVERYVKNIPIRTMEQNVSLNFYVRMLSNTKELYKYSGSTLSISLQDELEYINKINAPKELKKFAYMIAKQCDMLNLVPTLFQHCDLHFDNILFDGKKIYYIDFEYARNENFLFDIFNLPYVEFMDASTNFYIDLLLNHDKDIIYQIDEIFSSIGLQFKPQMVKVYIERFLVSRIRFDVLNADSKRKDFSEYCIFLLERYTKFWEYINNFRSEWNEV